jgi:aminoglycoside phosphotransferase family enzyme/predicted kinase
MADPPRRTPVALQQPPDEQAKVFAFLADPSVHPLSEPVVRIDTHAAVVFLAGRDAYKVKRAVKFPFLDYSTLGKRRTACEAELAVNRPNAPGIYLGVVPLTSAGGKLSINGGGEVVEWLLHMQRFDENETLDKVAARGGLSRELIDALCQAIFRSHSNASPAPGDGFCQHLWKCIEQNQAALLEHDEVFSRTSVDELTRMSQAAHAGIGDLLLARGREGFVKRCHGDLHLRNIVLIDGVPTLFDAIEFDEAIATGDVLYDLSFLIMDLWQRDLKHAANRVLNRYLWHGGASHYAALAALPLFLSLRAAIRAKVTAASLEHLPPAERPSAEAEAQRYLALAIEFLRPERPSVIAVGGLSGTGKSTLAAAMAPFTGRAPGAVHLRSDVERKAIWGIAETVPLPSLAYSPPLDKEIYARLNSRAALTLAAGCSVVIDAVYRVEEERHEAEKTVSEFGAHFVGLWLEAPLDLLMGRVKARRGDASDASPWVVEGQWLQGAGNVTWHRLDASDELDQILKGALALSAPPGAVSFHPAPKEDESTSAHWR